MNASTDVTPIFGALTACIKAKEPHAPTAEIFKGRLKGMFKVWDDILGRQKYAAGSELTIADFSLYAGYWRTKGAQPEVLAGLPNLERWGGGIGERPAVQRALKF
jgi:glutathione S-transferase